MKHERGAVAGVCYGRAADYWLPARGRLPQIEYLHVGRRNLGTYSTSLPVLSVTLCRSSQHWSALPTALIDGRWDTRTLLDAQVPCYCCVAVLLCFTMSVRTALATSIKDMFIMLLCRTSMFILILTHLIT